MYDIYKDVYYIIIPYAYTILYNPTYNVYYHKHMLAYIHIYSYIWITGRVDDVINPSGHRIGTAEVESALVACPEVSIYTHKLFLCLCMYIVYFIYMGVTMAFWCVMMIGIRGCCGRLSSRS